MFIVFALLAVFACYYICIVLREDKRWSSGNLTAQEHYDSLADRDLIAPECAFINMGLWKGVSIFDKNAMNTACRNLVDYVARAAMLVNPPSNESDASVVNASLASTATPLLPRSRHIIDAGCGYGGACFYLADKCPDAAIITGINVSKAQLERCHELLEQRQSAAAAAAATATTTINNNNNNDDNKAPRIDFVEASCTKLPFENEQLDVVWSLEASHHFDTRRDFFNECYRVLRSSVQKNAADARNCSLPATPTQATIAAAASTTASQTNESVKKPCLVWCDVIIHKPRNWYQRFMFKLVSSMMCVPAENTGNITTVKNELEEAGFDPSQMQCDCITALTIDVFRKFVITGGFGHYIKNPMSLILPGICWLLLPMDYYLIIAAK